MKSFVINAASLVEDNHTVSNPSVQASTTVWFVYKRTVKTDVALGKLVKGDYADKTKGFTFTVQLKDAKGDWMTGAITFEGSVIPDTGAIAPEGGSKTLGANGETTFTLAHGQAVILKNLPATAQIRIEEEDTNGVYTPSFKDSLGDPGSADTGFRTIGGQSRAFEFTNTRSISVPTGIADNPWSFAALPIAAVILLIAACLATTIVRRKLHA